MAKKKEDAAPAPEKHPVESAPKPAVRDYSERNNPYRSSRKWKGRTLYECRECAYNTAVEADIRTHVRLEHAAHINPTAPRGQE